MPSLAPGRPSSGARARRRSPLAGGLPVTLLAALVLPAGRPEPLHAQRQSSSEWLAKCEDHGDRRSERFCEVREETIPVPGGTLVVDGRQNGGVAVIGWERNQVRVVARIAANARTEERARAIAGEITVRTGGGRISTEGPETTGREWWSVTFEVWAPRRSDLDLRAFNGGVAVEGVSGELRLETVNGGIHLESVGGNVIAATTNGGLHINLEGRRWEGRGLDARTTNGGVHLAIPAGYSAELETGTVNGGVDIEFPVMVRGRIGRRITTTLGDGGSPVRATTTNGGVRVRRSR